jgi:hypothetical protein
MLTRLLNIVLVRSSNMTLQASGTISLNDVNLELRKASLSELSVNNEESRGLSQKATGAISFSNYYGRSFDFLGQEEFTTTGLHTWVCPQKVNTVHAVCVGGGGGGAGSGDGGGGGGGGGLGWKNNISVTAGETYYVYVGIGGNPNSLVDGVGSIFITTDAFEISSFSVASNVVTVNTSSAHSFETGDTVSVDCSFREINGTFTITKVDEDTFTYSKTFQDYSELSVTGVCFEGNIIVRGGGGDSGKTTFGGFSSPTDGMVGGTYNGDGGGEGATRIGRDASTAGGGGGAGGYDGNGGSQTGGCGGNGAGSNYRGGGGGGVGIYGEGASGANVGSYAGGGYGGSGGTRGGTHDCSSYECGLGGLYGGGGGGHDSYSAGYGTQGAVRIIWGSTRAFPTTQTEDVTEGGVYS